MADVNTKSCDQCGVLKKEVNHWWFIDANIKTKSMFVCPLSDNVSTKDNMYAGYDFIDFHTHIRLVACGLECLSILESKIKEGVNPLK